MHRPPLVAVLLAVAAVMSLPVPARAVPIHVTKIVQVGERKAVVERVVNVAPPDRDEDGTADSKDKCPDRSGWIHGCPPPPEPPVASPAQDYAPTTPVPTTVATGAGGCPASMAGEASSPAAVNPTSGASGCFQVLPSTAAAMGSACDDVNSSACLGAICAAQGNEAWAASGSTPCG